MVVGHRRQRAERLLLEPLAAGLRPTFELRAIARHRAIEKRATIQPRGLGQASGACRAVRRVGVRVARAGREQLGEVRGVECAIARRVELHQLARGYEEGRIGLLIGDRLA